MIEGDHEENKVCVYVTDSVSLEAALGEGLPRRFTDKYGFAAGATQGREQLAWLEEELSLDHTHECRWMVVTGHRPVFSGADREVFPAERPFQAKMHRLLRGKVHFYFNGHDHTFQHIFQPDDGSADGAAGSHFIVNGIGGYKELHPVNPLPGTRAAYSGFHGFSRQIISHQAMSLSVHDEKGRERYHHDFPWWPLETVRETHVI